MFLSPFDTIDMCTCDAQFNFSPSRGETCKRCREAEFRQVVQCLPWLGLGAGEGVRGAFSLAHHIFHIILHFTCHCTLNCRLCRLLHVILHTERFISQQNNIECTTDGIIGIEITFYSKHHRSSC